MLTISASYSPRLKDLPVTLYTWCRSPTKIYKIRKLNSEIKMPGRVTSPWRSLRVWRATFHSTSYIVYSACPNLRNSNLAYRSPNSWVAKGRWSTANYVDVKMRNRVLRLNFKTKIIAARLKWKWSGHICNIFSNR